jgi:hypothetical protein
MFLREKAKKYSDFRLRKGIIKNPIFGVKIWIERFWTIFAYIYKGWEVDIDNVFYDPKKMGKKYSKKVSDQRSSFDCIWVLDLCKKCTN